MLAEVRNPDDEILVTAATLVEIISKVASGRLIFDDDMLADIEQVSTWLPLSAVHALRVGNLPMLHKDPFDRIIVAQAMEEGMTLVTGERLLADYGVSVLLT